jgi:acetyl esterase/lipase
MGIVNTRHLVASELLAALEMFPPLSFTHESLPLHRGAQAELFRERASSAIAGVEVEDRHIQGPDGAPDVRVIIYRPAAAAVKPMPGVLHIHGGGHVVGLPEMNDARNATLVAQLGCVVVSVDYRLSPEAPFPAGLEDCYAALQWLNRNAEALGVDRKRLTVMGESAGGGMAAGLALMARDRGETALHAQLLVYPMLDDRSTASDNPATGEFIWTRELNAFGWSCLLRGHSGEPPAYAAPAYAQNLAGLPQTFIGVGALDLFLDEDIHYAQRLIRAGVAVTLLVVPGAFHGFDAMSQGRVATGFTRAYFDWLARIWDEPAADGDAASPVAEAVAM